MCYKSGRIKNKGSKNFYYPYLFYVCGEYSTTSTLLHIGIGEWLTLKLARKRL